MLKVRYFKIRLAATKTFGNLLAAAASDDQSPALQVVGTNAAELIVRFTTTRNIKTIQYLADGSSVFGTAVTMDQHSVRIFRDSTSIFLSLVEPGRGNQVITHLLDRLLGPANYFIDSLELNRAALQSYVQRFQSFKLVAAKIRDFQAYEKAIARLEISGKDGIADDIAPFVAGKFYRIDSLTYEVIHDFQKGLVTYFANGTLRVTQSLVHIAFPIFEDHLRSGV